MMLIRKRNIKAQTALEYFMVLAVIVLPLALTIRSSLESSDKREDQHIVKSITKQSLGDGKKMGVIGRPYP